MRFNIYSCNYLAFWWGPFRHKPAPANPSLKDYRVTGLSELLGWRLILALGLNCPNKLCPFLTGFSCAPYFNDLACRPPRMSRLTGCDWAQLSPFAWPPGAVGLAPASLNHPICGRWCPRCFSALKHQNDRLERNSTETGLSTLWAGPLRHFI